MGLVNWSQKTKSLPQPLKEEFITHTVWVRYGDGRIFPIKSWVTQKGKSNIKSKTKQRKEDSGSEKEGALCL